MVYACIRNQEDEKTFCCMCEPYYHLYTPNQTKNTTKRKNFIACAYDKPNDPRPYVLSVLSVCVFVSVFDDDHTKHSRKPEKMLLSYTEEASRECYWLFFFVCCCIIIIIIIMSYTFCAWVEWHTPTHTVIHTQDTHRDLIKATLHQNITDFPPHSTYTHSTHSRNMCKSKYVVIVCCVDRGCVYVVYVSFGYVYIHT